MNPIEMLNPIVLSVLAREEFASRINALMGDKFQSSVEEDVSDEFIQSCLDVYADLSYEAQKLVENQGLRARCMLDSEIYALSVLVPLGDGVNLKGNLPALYLNAVMSALQNVRKGVALHHAKSVLGPMADMLN